MRTAPLLHGTGPSTRPGDAADSEYMARLPADLKPAMGRYRITLGNWSPADLAKWLQAEKAAGRHTALVSCWPHRTLADGQVFPLDKEVAAGKFDPDFFNMAAIFAAYGGDVPFGFRAECNSGPDNPRGVSIPYVFVNAYRRAAGILHDYGDDTVSMLQHWTPSGSNPWAQGWNGLTLWGGKLDVGRKWAKMQGASIYSSADVTPGTKQYAMLQGIYDKAVERGQDFGICECSCAFPGVDGDRAVEVFFDRLAAFINTHQLVKFISYGQTPRSIPGMGETRLWTNEAVWRRWLEILRQPYFVHQAT